MIRAVGVGLVLLALAGCVVPDEEPAADRAAPEAGAVEVLAEPFAAQPDRRFIRVGTTGGRQFTEQEFAFLAENFDYVLFTKYHAGFDVDLHHEAARRLKELDPQIRVFPYFSTRYAFRQNDFGGPAFDDAWLLRDNEGEIVYRARGADADDPEQVPYVDLADPGYRDWALEVLRSWLAAAPYDGVSFDAAVPIGEYDEEQVAVWRERLGEDRVRAYNEGLRELLASTQQLVGDQREVIFNGITPSVERGPDRTLDLLDVADGALDETFCIDVRGEVRLLQEDLELMGSVEDRLFLRTHYSPGLPDAERSRVGRFCLGSFLLGWRPGLTYFHFGDSYTADQLGSDLADMNVELGSPTQPYESDGSLLSREFSAGELYVNVGDQPVTVRVGRDLVQVADGEEVGRLNEGDELTVPPTDAAFLVAVE